MKTKNVRQVWHHGGQRHSELGTAFSFNRTYDYKNTGNRNRRHSQTETVGIEKLGTQMSKGDFTLRNPTSLGVLDGGSRWCRWSAKTAFGPAVLGSSCGVLGRWTLSLLVI